MFSSHIPIQPIPEIAASVMIPGNLSEHPAVCAWRKLQPACVDPGSIDVLKRNKKSAIYRLHGIGPGASAVIAKRCVTTTALTERLIYQDVLPALALPGLRYYGCIEDCSTEFHWLFLEDAGRWGANRPARGNPGGPVVGASGSGLRGPRACPGRFQLAGTRAARRRSAAC